MSLAYAAMWVAFVILPDFKSALRAVPHLGPAIEWSAAIYLLAAILWLVWIFVV
jgi:hypothetical protein